MRHEEARVVAEVLEFQLKHMPSLQSATATAYFPSELRSFRLIQCLRWLFVITCHLSGCGGSPWAPLQSSSATLEHFERSSFGRENLQRHPARSFVWARTG